MLLTRYLVFLLLSCISVLRFANRITAIICYIYMYTVFCLLRHKPHRNMNYDSTGVISNFLLEKTI